ncbi:MAG: chemotaxis-specific protein-glutamate methyltransferase CheB [Verrucomicrobiota bacterium]
MKERIKVLVVEDSPVAQLLLVHILNSDPRLMVVGTANNGQEALAFLHKTKPDAIVMDIHMPGMDGYTTTRRIMETQPVPIIVCSASLNPAEVTNTFRALEAGALALVAKPVGLTHQDYAALARQLVETVCLMAEVKVVRRWTHHRVTSSSTAFGNIESRSRPNPVKVVAIGASTGGPVALQTILSQLAKPFPAPLLIVQHIADGFLSGLVEWLSQSTGFEIEIAAHGASAVAGRAYVGPEGYHMGFGPGNQIVLSKSAPENGLRPAISHLFRSVAETCRAQAIGILLTGMGRDGAEELTALNQLGALTIAQDVHSSVVHGMPGEAIKLGGASYVLAPDQIAAFLNQRVIIPNAAAVSSSWPTKPPIA